jgi:hypothetical protein
LATKQQFHRPHLRTTDDEDKLRGLKVLVPSVLERRERGRVGLGGIGQLIDHQDVALALQNGRGCLPQRRPGVIGRRGRRGGVSPEEMGEEFPSLQKSRLFLRNPVGERQPTLLDPIVQERGLADTAAAIEHDELAWPRPLPSEDGVKERKFRVAVKKHDAPH